MEPITYFYESINRNAIVVKPKKPFFDWLNYLYPESPVNEKEEANIYLMELSNILTMSAESAENAEKL